MTQKEKNNRKKAVRSQAKRVAILAMMTAVSIVIGLFCKRFFTVMAYYRFTLENIGILLSGIFFGPIAGAMVGLAADLLSCVAAGQSFIPGISLGAVTVGLISGAVPQLFRIAAPKANRKVVYAVTVAAAHLFGQVIIKSIVKIFVMGMPWYGIFIGLAMSAIAGTLEYSIIIALSKNRQIINILE